MLGAFKLDHLQPRQLLFLQESFMFFTFILGGQFLLPQRTNNGKVEFTQLQNLMRQMDFNAWGIQTGPFAVHLAHFVQKYFCIFQLHTGESFLITPEGQ